MSVRGWRVVAAGLAAVHVGGIVLGAVLPWTGTLAMAALCAYVWVQSPAWTLRAAFAAFAGVACCVELPSGGYGWPEDLQFAPGTLGRVAEGGLLVLGLAALAAHLVGRRTRRRLWRLLPAVAGLSVAVAVVFAGWAQQDAREQRAVADRIAMERYLAEREDDDARLLQARVDVYMALREQDVTDRPPPSVVAITNRVSVGDERATVDLEATYPSLRSYSVRPEPWWSFDPWNERFSWESTADALPAMLVLVLSALVAGLAQGRRDDELPAGSMPR